MSLSLVTVQDGCFSVCACGHNLSFCLIQGLQRYVSSAVRMTDTSRWIMMPGRGRLCKEIRIFFLQVQEALSGSQTQSVLKKCSGLIILVIRQFSSTDKFFPSLM